MDTPYLGQTTDIALGQDFLTWLWYKSEIQNNIFTTKDNKSFLIFMEQNIVVQGGEGEHLETAIVSGALSDLKEARIGLSTGKKVSKALLRFEQDSETWQLTIKAEDFSLSGLKTPKVDKDENNNNEDSDARFLEKIYLIETCLELLDTLYYIFLQTRLSPAWQDEVKRVGLWLEKSI